MDEEPRPETEEPEAAEKAPDTKKSPVTKVSPVVAEAGAADEDAPPAAPEERGVSLGPFFTLGAVLVLVGGVFALQAAL